MLFPTLLTSSSKCRPSSFIFRGKQTRPYKLVSFFHPVVALSVELINKWMIKIIQLTSATFLFVVTLFQVGRLYINRTAPSWDELESDLPELQPGGRWSPPDCKTRHRVAIIVPYRDRDSHLRMFLKHMHPMLERQQLEYGIFIIEQVRVFLLVQMYALCLSDIHTQSICVRWPYSVEQTACQYTWKWQPCTFQEAFLFSVWCVLTAEIFFYYYYF